MGTIDEGYTSTNDGNGQPLELINGMKHETMIPSSVQNHNLTSTYETLEGMY